MRDLERLGEENQGTQFLVITNDQGSSVDRSTKTETKA